MEVLLSITNTLSDEDKIQCSAIHQTYLSYYKNAESPHRISSFNTYQSTTAIREEFDMMYSFVVGSDTSRMKYPIVAPLRQNVCQYLVIRRWFSLFDYQWFEFRWVIFFMA